MKNYKSNYKYNKQLRDKHDHVKYDIKNTKFRGEQLKHKSFRMCLNLNDYMFKTSRYSFLSTYMNPMAI